MKKALTSIFLIILSLPVYAKNINTDDLVDVFKYHSYYKDLKLSIDEYKFIKPYPDHTFRGKWYVNHFQYSESILKLIKYIELKKNISLKKSNENYQNFLEKDNFFNEGSINKDSLKILIELAYVYGIILSPPSDISFNGKKFINRFELSYGINKLIKLVNLKKNKKIEATKNIKLSDVKYFNNEYFWINESVKNSVNYQIIKPDKNNKFFGKNKINRFELSKTLNRLINFLDENL